MKFLLFGFIIIRRQKEITFLPVSSFVPMQCLHILRDPPTPSLKQLTQLLPSVSPVHSRRPPRNKVPLLSMNLKAMSLFLFTWEESHHASNKFRCMIFYNPPINFCVILLAILDHKASLFKISSISNRRIQSQFQ